MFLVAGQSADKASRKAPLANGKETVSSSVSVYIPCQWLGRDIEHRCRFTHLLSAC